ncbi:DUF935 domain-containing protein [Dethiosulfovibrio sp. F2B]|uniref:phage portal protein family protein n=1 Tax=Dethiosulfovibrio faecalis TaxID=2720018 RepID=UPI001F217949|nr:DUF935 domain-containing protein [Dethiosulfovibrio faecalis]
MKEKSKVFGFGYSDLAMQLMSAMDQPVANNDYKASQYKEMLNDETIGTGMEYLCYSIVGKIRGYSHPDEKIKDLIDNCQMSLRGTLEEARRSLLENGLGYGFGVSEFSLFENNGALSLSSLQSYDPQTLKFIFGKGEDNAIRIAKIRQSAGGKDLDIPVEKCVVYRHGTGSTPYGRSRLRRCWRWYAFKRAIPKFWAVALERFGMPALVGKSEDTEQMDKILSGAHSKSHFAIGLEDEISTLNGGTSGNGTTMGTGYEQALSFCNKMLYRAMFLPSLLEGGEGGGSYSLGAIHWRMFNDACLWLARELAEVEIEQLWRPIIEWNFGPQESYGELDVSDSGTPDEKKIMSEVFLNAVNGGYIYPDEGDAEWMRERLGFPEEPEGGEAVPWRSRLLRNNSLAGSKESEMTPSKPE